MKIALVAATLVAAFAGPASAVTVANGVILFNQADALAGNVTPGDTPGFPVTISASGVYRLSGNLAPTAGHGIEVTAAEVTIDLFGFRMAGSSTAIRAINSSGRALTVMNGTIRGFTQYGIYTTGTDTFIQNMRISSNRYGLYSDTALVGGYLLRNSVISNNTEYGVVCRENCHIEGNVVSGNKYGIWIESGSVIGNTITSNSDIAVSIEGEPAEVGVGNNTIVGSAIQIRKAYKSLIPNACQPACSAPSP